MRARDLAVQIPPVRMGDPVTKAVRVMVESGLPGLVVVDRDDAPQFVLPGSQVLKLMVSHYSGDSALARTIDEAHADQFWSDLGSRSVGDCVSPDQARMVQVREDATLLEAAIVMSQLRAPLIAVVDQSGRLTGCLTLNALLSAVPPST